MYKFCNISVNFENIQMVDHILKILRPGAFDISMFILEYCMDQRRYKSRHRIPMFIWTPCSQLKLSVGVSVY